MQIPTKDQCELLLTKYNFPERKRRHVEKVAEVATFLGKRLELKGKKLNLDLVYVGGLLHDIDKGVEGAGVVHPSKGMEILIAEGYPEVARICETHTINAFLDPKTIPATWEEKCVALADKMVKNEVIGVEERFRLWREECETELQKVSRVSPSSVQVRFMDYIHASETSLRKGKQVPRVPQGENTDGEQGNTKALKMWETQKSIIEKSYVKVKELEKEICGIIGLRPEDILNILK